MSPSNTSSATHDLPQPLIRDICAGNISEGMTFAQRAWAITARIPKGQVSTYGAIADAMGHPRAARAVGQAMHDNPLAPEVPCHRVVASNGKLNGFAHGLDRKATMLEAEGVEVDRERDRVDLKRYGCELPDA